MVECSHCKEKLLDESDIQKLSEIEFRLANIQIQYTHTTLAQDLNEPILWVRKLKEAFDKKSED